MYAGLSHTGVICCFVLIWGGRYGGVKRFGVIFFLKSVNISFFLKKSVVLGLRI